MKNFLNDDSKGLKLLDYLFLFVVMIFFGFLAFHNLGDTKMPQTYYTLGETGDSINYDFKEELKISKIRLFVGSSSGDIRIYLSKDGETYPDFFTVKLNNVFSWQDISIDAIARYVMVEGSTDSEIGELRFYDGEGNPLEASLMGEGKQALYDELDLVPKVIDYKNSMYFDEIYFARSAYEYVHNKPTYEWVHPPLGKLIQAIPIALFGMSPFTYRMMSVVAGILLIPLMYLFAKELFGKRKYMVLAALLMTFDNFHLVHSRMGTIDTHLVLFILASFYFMVRYMKRDITLPARKKFLDLLFSAFFIGCAISTKWIGLFGGLGLTVLFFTHYFLNYTKKNTWKDGLKILEITILVFTLVPIFVYLFTYFAFPNLRPYQIHSLSDFLNQTNAMYEYHSNLGEWHDFMSSWYTWPLMMKPVWYHVSYLSETVRETISGIGNPMIWWVGAVSMGYLIASFIENRKMEKYILLVSILTLWIPFAFIKRVMFLYHFYPALPFVMLSIVLMLKELRERRKTDRILIWYLCLVILFFLLFYPVTSGIPVSENYIKWISWAGSWLF